MSVRAFNSLSNGEYSNLFIVAAFSSNSFPGKTSLPVLDFFIDCFDFLTNNQIFQIKFISKY